MLANVYHERHAHEALEEALARHGKPEIFNTERTFIVSDKRSLRTERTFIGAQALTQGSQFTSVAFTDVLKAAGIAISMDGKGAWRDNVFVERLWRTIKYEEVYLHAYASVSEARAAIGRYLTFYNGRRPHSSLDRQTPDQAYFNALQPIPAAA